MVGYRLHHVYVWRLVLDDKIEISPIGGRVLLMVV